MIRQFDKKVLYIPNQSFSNMIFVNASQMTHRRLENLIKIRYSDAKKTNMIIKELRETLSKRKDIDHSQSNHVHLVNFDDSALEIKMTLYTKRTSNADFWAFTEEILTLVYEIIEKHGAQMAFPTTTIDLVDKNQLQNTLPFGQ